GHDPDAWEEIDAVRLFSATDVSYSNDTPELSDDPATASVDEDDSVDLDVADLASDDDVFFLSITTDPEHGYLTINDNDTPDDLTDDYITYIPDPDYHGDDSFDITVRDIFGASVTGTVDVTVAPVNDAPWAEDDFAVGDENSDVTLHVLDNDSAIDE